MGSVIHGFELPGTVRDGPESGELVDLAGRWSEHSLPAATLEAVEVFERDRLGAHVAHRGARHARPHRRIFIEPISENGFCPHSVAHAPR